jgi:hypothetical protein
MHPTCRTHFTLNTNSSSEAHGCERERNCGIEFAVTAERGKENIGSLL